MTRDSSDENTNLPPWLRDVPLPPRPRGADERADVAAPRAPIRPADPTSSAGLPDWLRDSSTTEPASAPDALSWMDSPAQPPMPAQTSEQAALPDWLRDTQSAPSSSTGSEQLPSWLSDLAGTDDSPQEPPLAQPPAAPAQSESSLPDWLRDSQRDAAPSTGAEQLPSWLSESDETPSGAPLSAGESPAWLSDLTTESPAAAEPTAVPDWLSNTSDVPPSSSADTDIPSWLSADSTPTPTEPTAVPDWLSSASGSAHSNPSEAESLDLWASEPGATPEQQRSTGGRDAGVPDWLRDISAEDTGESDITAEPFSFEGATGAAPQGEKAGPPAWLSAEDTPGTVPDWLRSAVDQSEELAGAAPEMPAVPLWLQDVDSQPADTAAPAAPETNQATPAPAAEQESLPPWLRDEPTQAPAPDTPSWLQSQPTESSAASDIPDWLREPEPSTQLPPADDVPAWLRQEPANADTASTSFTQEQDNDTLPGIMRADIAGTPAEPSQRPPTPADDLPDWLRPSAPNAAPDKAQGQDLPPWLRDESGQPLPSAGGAGDAKLPAWLRGVSTDVPPSAPANEPPAAPANFEWLDQASQAEARRAPTESEFFGSTELPAWLRPPEAEQPKEISQADARSLDWLTRLGGTEEPEVVAPTTVAAPKLAPLVTRPRSAAHIEAVALLERLAAAPFSEPAPLPAHAQPSVWRQIGIERALYVLLLITLLAALLAPLPNTFGLAVPPSAPGAAELFEQIDKLSANDVVLVGYEWDARRSSELRPLENAVLGHLIQRNVKLVLASTDPQGTLLLFDFRDQLERAGYRKGGEDYILLGYKPGAELALRLFAQDFRSVLKSDFQGNDATISALATGADPSKPRLNSLSDFSMVMVLADEAQDVQGWMEQVHRSAQQTPLAFLLPNETTPVVQPYLSQPGIFHLAGKQGALAYQSLRGDSGMPIAQIARETTQQRLSMLVFVVLLLVGAVIVGAGTAAARRGRA